MSEYILSCKGLTKSYVKDKFILKDFSIDLKKGKIIGLLGPNGCGKSTFLKLITGLLTPDSGEILIDGEPRSEKTNAVVAYLPERTYLDPGKRVCEIVSYFADFYSDFDKKHAYEMLKSLDIDTSQRLRELSKGTREKVQLVLVMARKAKLYLLDEPIGGVDPAARDYILKTIIGNYNPEATVVITTHLIYDIEPVLDEFYFLARQGRITAYGSVDAVREDRGQSLDELFKEVYKC